MSNLYKVHLQTDSPMLGTAPENSQLYADFVVARKFSELKELEKKGKLSAEEAIAYKDEKDALAKVELQTLPEDGSVARGTTVFRRVPKGQPDEGALMLPAYMVKGFLKESSQACGLIDKKGEVSTWGLSQKVGRWVFVTDENKKPLQYVVLTRDGQPLMAPEISEDCPTGIFSRPLRAQTAQGPRIAIAASEQINAGAELDFCVYIMPLGEDSKFGRITGEVLKSWLSYGQYVGLGQFRGGNYGAFSVEVTPVQ